jgi:Protein of unknown function (DUF3313)
MPRHVWTIFLLLAGPAFAQITGPQSINGLERVPNAKVAMAYVKQGLDLSRYHTIQLLPLNIPVTARNTAPTGTRSGFGQTWILPDRSVAELQRAYDEITREELAKGGSQFVTAPQADTLIIAAEIKNIQLNAPIDDHAAGPRAATFTRGVGSMTLAVALGDGSTGQVVAIAQDRKVSDDRWTYSNASANMADARRAFHEWGALLRERLAHP